MIVEAQLDRSNGIGRQAVTACLARDYDGDDDLGEHGLARALHAGAVAGRLSARRLPARRQPPDVAGGVRVGRRAFAGWMLVEEVAEGGDVLHQNRGVAGIPAGLRTGVRRRERRACTRATKMTEK